MAVQSLQPDSALQSEQLLVKEEASQLQVIWRRFRKHRLALLGAGILSVFVLAALVAPIIAPPVPIGETGVTRVGLLYAPNAIDPPNQHLEPLSGDHILGTDEVGRDVLSRLLFGARVSLFVGIVATLGSETIGMLIGAIAGYYGGTIDAVLMRITDFMLTLPLLPILLVLSAMLTTTPPNVAFHICGSGQVLTSLAGTMEAIGMNASQTAVNPSCGGAPGLSAQIPQEVNRLMILIAILVTFSWMGAARLVRGVILSLRQQEFTEASRALGASDWRIILRHMLPNSLAPIIVNSTLAVGNYIIIEAALSFLGFGVQQPTPSWGNMLSAVQQYMFYNPTLAIWPGLCIFLTVLSINFMGDGLRDALDPRMRGRGTAG